MTAAEKWLKLAKDDIHSAEILLDAEIFNMVCFHCQQAVEKSLKAYLRYHSKKIPYIHILEELCGRCAEIDSTFSHLIDDCVTLDIFYQPSRYPEAPTGSLPEGMPNKNKLTKGYNRQEAFFSLCNEK